MQKNEQIIIRPAYIEDAHQIFTLRTAIIKEDFYLLPTIEENIHTEEEKIRYISALQGAPSTILLAEHNNIVIGVLGFQQATYKRIQHSGMLEIYIAKEYREQGIGSLLMKTFFEWLAKYPIIEIVNLKAHATNARALHFYKKLGFNIDGIKKKGLKYDKQYIDIVMMSKMIENQ